MSTKTKFVPFVYILHDKHPLNKCIFYSTDWYTDTDCLLLLNNAAIAPTNSTKKPGTNKLQSITIAYLKLVAFVTTPNKIGDGRSPKTCKKKI
jgi:hypothetical protein